MAFTEKVTAILQLLLYHFFQNTVIPKYTQTLESYTLCNFYTTWVFYTRFTSFKYNSLFYRKIPDEQMIDSVVKELTEEELEALVKALTKLNTWFRSF